jgi:hypothetical protein
MGFVRPPFSALPTVKVAATMDIHADADCRASLISVMAKRAVQAANNR